MDQDIRLRFGRRMVWARSGLTPRRVRTRLPRMWLERSYPQWAGCFVIRAGRFWLVVPQFGEDRFAPSGVWARLRCAWAARREMRKAS